MTDHRAVDANPQSISLRRSSCTFADVEAAWLSSLRTTALEPEFENSRRGFQSREILGLTYRVRNPRERAVRVRARRANLAFNFAEVLWYLRGSASVDEIAFYAPGIAQYSRDGRTLQGTAYGPRIFHGGSAAIDQWQQVIDTLTGDNDSKRAVLQIFAAEELLDPSSIDVACTLNLQYMIREGALHSVAFMRANDAFVGAVSDAFAFTFMQELMATQLGLQLGTYTLFAGSYHLYRHDDGRADAVLASPHDPVSMAPFPTMPAADNWPYLVEVQTLERRIRTSGITPTRRDLESVGLPAYWTQIVALLASFAHSKRTGEVDLDLHDLMPPLYRAMFDNANSAPVTSSPSGPRP